MKSLLIKVVREGLGRVIAFISFVTRPKRIKRDEASQKQVNLDVKNLALYQFYGCPFCIKTRRTIHKLNLPMTYKDASKAPYRQELEQGGGRVKVPCLKIEEQGAVRWMYESNDIIDYLNQRFA